MPPVLSRTSSCSEDSEASISPSTTRSDFDSALAEKPEKPDAPEIFDLTASDKEEDVHDDGGYWTTGWIPVPLDVNDDGRESVDTFADSARSDSAGTATSCCSSAKMSHALDAVPSQCGRELGQGGVGSGNIPESKENHSLFANTSATGAVNGERQRTNRWQKRKSLVQQLS